MLLSQSSGERCDEWVHAGVSERAPALSPAPAHQLAQPEGWAHRETNTQKMLKNSFLIERRRNRRAGLDSLIHRH